MKKKFVCVFNLILSLTCYTQTKFDSDSVFRLFSFKLYDQPMQNFVKNNSYITKSNDSYFGYYYGNDFFNIRFEHEDSSLGYPPYSISLLPGESLGRNLPFGLEWSISPDDVIAHLGKPFVELNVPANDWRLMSYFFDNTLLCQLIFRKENNGLQLGSFEIKARNQLKPDNTTTLLGQKQFGKIKKVIPANFSGSGNIPVKTNDDFCSFIKNLLADVTNDFAQQKKIKQLTPKSWQLENKIPGAVFTELKQNNYPVNGKTVYTYYARVKDNITQGPEANKALEELKNKINACLPGYKMKESSLSLFTDNPDEVLGYSWKTGYNKPSVELSREITSSGKANIFLIIKPD
jgi:hypothetical protein